jgi:hypothetical protein
MRRLSFVLVQNRGKNIWLEDTYFPVRENTSMVPRGPTSANSQEEQADDEWGRTLPPFQHRGKCAEDLDDVRNSTYQHSQHDGRVSANSGIRQPPPENRYSVGEKLEEQDEGVCKL